MHYDLNDEIQSFMLAAFTPEKRDEYQNSLALFEAFGYHEVYQNLPSILFESSETPMDIIQGGFETEIHRGLTYLLQQHQIVLVDDATLEQINAVVGMLYRLQFPEDPSPLLRLLESQDSDGEQFARLLEVSTGIDEMTGLSLLESIAPSTLQVLKSYLAQKEAELEAQALTEGDVQAKSLLVQRLQAFFTVAGTENLAYSMIEAGIKVGYSLETYLPYVEHHLSGESPVQTAKNWYSLFLLAKDTSTVPMQAFREHSELLEDLKTAPVVEKAMLELDGLFNHYLRAPK